MISKSTAPYFVVKMKDGGKGEGKAQMKPELVIRQWSGSWSLIKWAMSNSKDFAVVPHIAGQLHIRFQGEVIDVWPILNYNTSERPILPLLGN